MTAADLIIWVSLVFTREPRGEINGGGLNPVGRFRFWSLIVVLSLVLSACDAVSFSSATATPDPSLRDVDTLFREMYQLLGGVNQLGPAISDRLDINGKWCQYTTTVQMCYDPLAPDSSRLGLSPLGQQFSGQIGEIDESIQVFESFTTAYQKLYGARFAGRPVTNVRYNYRARRIEQYFENLAMYHYFGDAENEVHLLDLGSLSCDSDCRYHNPNSKGAVIISDPVVDVPFSAQLDRLGGFDTFGMPLTNPHLNDSGQVEQAFTNAVFTFMPEQLTSLSLMPLGLLLDMPVTEPDSVNDPLQEGVVFYPINDQQGYPVPLQFDVFIVNHGNREIFGKPISHAQQVEGQDIYRQCFENLCLDYDPSLPEEQRVSLAPLGELYQQRFFPDSASIFKYSPETVQLIISEVYPQIPANERQTIQIVVLERGSNQPLANIESSIEITLPDGSVNQITISPTGPDGTSQVELPAVRNAPSGTIIPYQVCLNVPGDSPVCANENYLIWNSH